MKKYLLVLQRYYTQRPKTSIFGLFLLSVILVGGTFAAQNSSDVERDDIAEQRKLNRFVLEEPAQVIPLELSGTVESDQDVMVSSELGGVINVLYVDAGDEVYKGQLLAIIDHEEIDTQLLTAQAAYTQAQAYADAGADNAESSLEQTYVLRDTQIEQAQESLEHAIEQGFDLGGAVVARSVSSLSFLAGVQHSSNSSTLYSPSLVEGYKEQAIKIIFNVEDAGSYSAPYIAQLEGGLQTYFQDMQDSGDNSEVSRQLHELQNGLSYIKKAYDEIRPAAYQSEMIDEGAFEDAAAAVVSDISSITTTIQAIDTASVGLDNAEAIYDTQVQVSETSLMTVQKRGNRRRGSCGKDRRGA
jgi:multidrug efflux pump subunit AcrA (membrane-fusion protein)